LSRSVSYKRRPQNNESELHVAYRCSNNHAKYLPVSLYSVLKNNNKVYVYIYVFTDYISGERLEKLENICKEFENYELIFIEPLAYDISRIRSKTLDENHGWGLVSLPVLYIDYLSEVDIMYNLGVDTYCLGELSHIRNESSLNAHYVGTNGSGHQYGRSNFSLSKKWIGFDAAMINFALMRQDGITSEKLIAKSISEVGFVSDEVAFNTLCRREFLDKSLHYIFTGSHRPRKLMDKNTVVVDFYSILKPWNSAVAGYAVYDEYIKLYNEVSEIITLEYHLPNDFRQVIKLMRMQKIPFWHIIPLRLPILSRTSYRFLSLSVRLLTYLKNIKL